MQQNDLFRYTICNNLKKELKSKILITSVTFDVSRYGKYNHKINFNNPISIMNSIEKVEEFLSEKVSENYYRNIKDDLFYTFSDYGRDMEYICSLTRGQLLTDCIYLVEIEIYKNSLVLRCES